MVTAVKYSDLHMYTRIYVNIICTRRQAKPKAKPKAKIWPGVHILRTIYVCLGYPKTWVYLKRREETEGTDWKEAATKY